VSLSTIQLGSAISQYSKDEQFALDSIVDNLDVDTDVVENHGQDKSDLPSNTSGPIGSKENSMATNVWSFFTQDEGYNQCEFCKCISFILALPLYCDIIN
jgi:hypothetical protein